METIFGKANKGDSPFDFYHLLFVEFLFHSRESILWNTSKEKKKIKEAPLQIEIDIFSKTRNLIEHKIR